MRIATSLQRNTWMALSLVLLAGGNHLAAQTPPATTDLVVYNNLQFAHQVNTPPPAAQSVRVYSAPANVPYTATVATQPPGGSWLLVNASGNTSPSPSQDLSVSVNPAGLGPAQYTGTITVTSGTINRTINVVLTVSASAQVRLDPASLPNLMVEAGKATTSPLSIISTGVPTPYIAQVASIEPNTGWLTVLPANGSTGTPAQIVVNAAAIPADRTLVIGALRITPTANGGPVSLVISVTVTPGAQLQVSPTLVNFPFQPGFSPPPVRTVTVGSSTQTALTYNASITTNTPWLSLSASPFGPGSPSVTGLTTPSPLYLIPNVAAVPPTPGVLETTVQITAPSTNSSRTVTVRLTISSSPQLSFSQDAAVFSYTLGGTVPQPNGISVTSTSAPQQFTATSVYDPATGGDFFTVTPTAAAFTPTNVIVTLNQTRLATFAAGSYAGLVRVTTTATPPVTVDLPVTLTVSGSALITLDSFQTQLFEAPQGATPPARSIIVRSTDATSQPFTITVEYGPGANNWLLFSQTTAVTGTTGIPITLNVNPTAVNAAGTYDAVAVITPTGVTNAPPVRLQVRYSVLGTSAVTAAPTTFALVQMGALPPPPQTITLSSTTAGGTYFATSQQAWIRFANPGGTLPGAVQFTLDTAAFTPGSYTGSVVISTQNPAQTITVPVTLTVNPSATLGTAPTSLNFAFTQGSPVPTSQVLNPTSSGPAINFTAAASTANGVNWLSVTPTSGSTGATGNPPTALTVAVNPQALAPGSYPGAITLTNSFPGSAPVVVNVVLTVSAPAPPNGISLVNAATGLARNVSPGQIITIKGRSMAPATATEFTLANGVVPTRLGEVVVTFDGIEAPLLYVGPAGGGGGDQINAIVPYGVSGRLSTQLVVQYQGVTSAPLSLSVREAEPGIFTANQSGSGQASVRNQDNAVNSTSSPAARGSVISIYGTGEGLVTPALSDGRQTPVTAPFPRPLLMPTVRIGGVMAQVTYAGSAPGLVAGVFQLNAVIPANLAVTAPMNVPVEVQFGTFASQPNVTVAVRP